MITDPTITTTTTIPTPPLDLAAWATAHGHWTAPRLQPGPRAPRARTTKKATRTPLRRRTSAEKAASSEWPFSCLRCGDIILVVDNTYAEETRVRRVIPCHCGTAASEVASADTAGPGATGVAGVLHERRLRFYCHSGMLERDHSVSWDSEPLETAATSERHHTNVACLACLRADVEDTGTPDGLGVSGRGGAALDRVTTTRLPEVWTCACVSCGAQVPFGFSEPNRGGTVWPVTGEDFDPARAPYPEPRFADVWRRRDWLLVMGTPATR